MRLSIYSALLCSTITFYLFTYIDGLLLLVCTALLIVLDAALASSGFLRAGVFSVGLARCCLLVGGRLPKARGGGINPNNDPRTLSKAPMPSLDPHAREKLLLFRQCLFFASISALLAYNAAFRHSIQMLTQNSPISTSNILPINTTAIFATISEFFQHIEVSRVAKHAFAKLQRYVSNDTASMLIALITGQKEFMHGAFSDIFRRNGISHLLALSGFHLSLIIIGMQSTWSIIKKITSIELHRIWMEATIIVFVWIYCLWIGFIPSLYRAALMYTLATIIRHHYGIDNFLLGWTVTGMLLVLVKPDIMYSHGFILSMLALLGVRTGLYYSAYLCRVLPPALAVPICIGLGATLCTAWYSLIAFGASYPIGIITSLLLTPLITLFMVVGIGFLALVYLAEFIPTLVLLLSYVGQALDILIDGVRILLATLSRSISINSFHILAIYYLLMISAILLYKQLILKRRGNGSTRNIQRIGS